MGEVEVWRREGCALCFGPGLLYGLVPARVGVAGLQVEGVGGAEGVRELFHSEMPSRGPIHRYYGGSLHWTLQRECRVGCSFELF